MLGAADGFAGEPSTRLIADVGATGISWVDGGGGFGLGFLHRFMLGEAEGRLVTDVRFYSLFGDCGDVGGTDDLDVGGAVWSFDLAPIELRSSRADSEVRVNELVSLSFTEIRAILLKEHAELRLLALALEQAFRMTESERTVEAPRRLRAFVDALVAHNAREEELLGEILPNIDAWGEFRALRMDDVHRQTHHELNRALLAFAKEDPSDSAEIARALVQRVLEHMDEEEEAFLNDHVLRDDIVTIGQTSG